MLKQVIAVKSGYQQTLSGGELLDVLVTLGSCRLAMDHHWVSDRSGRRHRITVIMEMRRNWPQLSTRHDDDDMHCINLNQSV